MSGEQCRITLPVRQILPLPIFQYEDLEHGICWMSLPSTPVGKTCNLDKVCLTGRGRGRLTANTIRNLENPVMGKADEKCFLGVELLSLRAQILPREGRSCFAE
jgi:hypothetical protein